jgi:hypothetical protein
VTVLVEANLVRNSCFVRVVYVGSLVIGLECPLKFIGAAKVREEVMHDLHFGICSSVILVIIFV